MKLGRGRCYSLSRVKLEKRMKPVKGGRVKRRRCSGIERRVALQPGGTRLRLLRLNNYPAFILLIQAMKWFTVFLLTVSGFLLESPVNPLILENCS